MFWMHGTFCRVLDDSPTMTHSVLSRDSDALVSTPPNVVITFTGWDSHTRAKNVVKALLALPMTQRPDLVWVACDYEH